MWAVRSMLLLASLVLSAPAHGAIGQASETELEFSRDGLRFAATLNPYMEIAAGDLLAAVDLLSSQPEIDASRVDVFGHSQGAWIAPLAASMDPRVAFVVAISGGGVRIPDQVIFRMQQELLAAG